MNNPRINAQQRESAAKYLYDVSKGALLAGVAGAATGKISTAWFVGTFILAIISYIVAFQVEGEQS